jgi:hypothetical protein
MGGVRFDNLTQRKNVVKYTTQTIVEPKVIIEKPVEVHKIISESVYTTTDETFLIVRGVEYSEVTLNSSIVKKITVKSLTQTLIKSDTGSIDEEWDELLLEKGACVKFKFVDGNWYIVSSDGLKMS